MTYAFGFFSRLLFAFLLDIDVLYLPASRASSRVASSLYRPTVVLRDLAHRGAANAADASCSRSAAFRHRAPRRRVERQSA
jgi:hypothetical protein